MTQPYTGGCDCGAIRYQVDGEPAMMNDCQCRQCQRDSGTGHQSHLTFVGAAVEITGRASHWEAVGDGGTRKSRAFCPTCGAPVYLTFPDMPDRRQPRRSGPLPPADRDLDIGRLSLGPS